MTTTDVNKTHYPVSPRIHRDRVRFAIMLLLSSVGILAILSLSVSYIQLKDTVRQGGIRLTEKDMINGGKRFIDYFYSYNSRTVKDDQYDAIAMILDPQKALAQTQYLARTEFVTKVIEANMTSHIDWRRTKITVLTPTEPNSMRVEYKGKLVVNRSIEKDWHMILILYPTEMSEMNPTGVGIKDYIDIAENPLYLLENN